RPTLTDSAKFLLDIRDQFGFYSVPVWTQIGRVHRIGIVIVRVGVLYLNDKKTGEMRCSPLLVKFVRLLLLDAVITRNVEALTIVGLQIRIGRLGSKSIKISREMAVINRQRKACFGVLIEAFRNENIRAEIHGPAPEFGQQLRPNSNVSDVFGVFGR